MKTLLVVAGMLAFTQTAYATDKMLILNDQEMTALRQILDEATKYGGLQSARVAIYFDNKLSQAMIVTGEHKNPDKADEKKLENKTENKTEDTGGGNSGKVTDKMLKPDDKPRAEEKHE